MFMELVLELLQKYEELEAANSRFADAVRADRDLPLLLPECVGAPNRELAIKAMTRIWHLEPGESLPQAGVVCSSPATILIANELNEIKKKFKAAIISVRDELEGNTFRLDKCIERLLLQQDDKDNARRRNKELQLALKRTKIDRLDLLRCYANVRVLPKDLISISWTWARTHSAIDPISRENAILQAEKLNDGEAKDVALTLLTALEPGQMLAYKKKLPNQLRANLLYHENGDVKRKAVTISGIALSQDSTLPKKWVWRDDPGEQDPKAPMNRIPRSDSRIDLEPYIKALHLHLYST